MKTFLFIAVFVAYLAVMGYGAVGSEGTWDYSYMRMQKQALFGSVPSEYKLWFGLRGYGFGDEMGYIGSVGGTRINTELYVPDWLSFLSTKQLWKKEDGETYYRNLMKLDIVFDNFVYISLDGLKKYPDDLKRWLFWEANILLALR